MTLESIMPGRNIFSDAYSHPSVFGRLFDKFDSVKNKWKMGNDVRGNLSDHLVQSFGEMGTTFWNAFVEGGGGREEEGGVYCGVESFTGLSALFCISYPCCTLGRKAPRVISNGCC